MPENVKFLLEAGGCGKDRILLTFDVAPYAILGLPIALSYLFSLLSAFLSTRTE